MKIYLWNYLIVALLFFNSSSLAAQYSREDSLSIRSYFSQVEYFFFSNPPQSIAYCDSVILKAEKLQWPEQKLKGLLAKAKSNLILGDLSLVKENLVLFEESKARASLEETNELRWLEVRNKKIWAFYYRDIGKQSECLSILDTLIEEMKSLPLADEQASMELRETYVVAGTIYNLKGDFEKALSYFLEARRLNDKPGIYASFIAALYASKKEYKKAKKYYREYFSTEVKSPNKNKKRNNNLLSTACRGIAGVYLKESQPDSAMFYLRKSLNYIEATDLNYYYAFYLMGQVYLAVGDSPMAIKYFQEALHKKENALSAEKEHEYTPIYQGIGEAHLQEGKIKEALDYFQLAMIHLVPDFKEKNIHQNPSLNNPNIYKELLDVFEKKIDALYQLQKKDAAVFQNIAFESTQDAIALIDSIRLDYFGEEDKQFLLAQSYSIFEKSIDLAVSRGAYDQAFELSEKSKALVLYDAMKIKRAQALTALDDQLLIEKAKIEKRLMKWQQALQEAKNEEEEEIARLGVFDAKKAFARVLEKMEQNPEFRAAYREMKIADPAQIAQENLKRGQVLLEFFKGEKYLYAFLIRAGKTAVEVQRIEWTEDLENRMVRFNELIRRSDQAAEEGYVEDAQFLFEKLLAPSLGQELPKSLILIPDGVLAYLPFAALITKEVKKKEARNFKHHAYLGKAVALSQWFSVSASMLGPHAEIHRKWNTNLLAYAPAFRAVEDGNIAMRGEVVRSQLFPLQHNKTEIKDIAENINPSTLLTGALASKQHFLINGPTSRLLHFATHGKVDEEQPKRSYIAFSNETDTNFKLGLNELYHMNLRAEMVVLSACETGLGKIVKGEGTISIARGFIYAGARSVLTTLWSINDQSTCDLMKQFYQELRNGCRKDEALRLAVNHYVEELAPDHKRAHPRYWAAFTAIGDMEKIDLGSNFNLKWVLLFSMFGLGFFWFYFKSQKTSR